MSTTHSRRTAVPAAIVTAVLIATGVSLIAAPGQSQAGISRDKVLVVGIDGLRYDKLIAASAPNLKRLAARGTLSPTTLYAPPFSYTLSGPGWATIATGVWPDKHRVTGNDFPSNRLDRYPDFLTRLERVNPRFSTFAASDWAQLALHRFGGPVFSDAIDVKLGLDADLVPGGTYAADDQKVVDASARHLRLEDPDAAFVYIGQTDMDGHLHGGESREYARSIEVDDRQVGRLLRAIRSRPTYRRERWTVIVTTDHGHTARGGHGGSEQSARTSLILAAGPGLPAGRPRVQPRNVDVASTVFRSLGVRASPDWGLDGRPLAKASSDPFDATAVGRVPAGWRIDNRRMGPGGVREWRGWRFTTDARWTRAGRDEQRENFVRSRGVIAVADPDLSGGAFDSTLTSAPYRVGGARRIAISFGAHYRQGAAQQGRVSVSFDGGRRTAVLDYGPAPGRRTANRGRDVISKRHSATLDVPRGARELRLHFRLHDAGGGGYWAIDEPRVKPAT